MQNIVEVATDILFASSGPVSLGQQIANIFNIRQSNIRTGRYFEEMPRLQTATLAVLKPAFEGANMAVPLLGQNIAAQDAICGYMFAAPFADGMKLVEVSPQAQFSFLNDTIPFTTMGSGKSNADQFLSFLYSIYWKDKAPTVQGGILTAYWTARAAIESASQGVGFYVDVSVISKTGGKWTIQHYHEKDLGEHQGFIEDAKGALRDLRDKILGAPTKNGSAKSEPPPTMPST